MKRFLPVAGALAIVLTAGGAGAAPAPPAKQAAVAKALRLLHAFVPPQGAVRPRKVPTGYRWPMRDPGQGVLGKRVDRHRFWLVHGTVHSVESLREKGWGSPGMVIQGGRAGNDENAVLTFAVPGFGGRSTERLLTVQAVRRGGGTLLRVDVVVVWRLSAAQREKLPAGVRSIEIRGPHAAQDVTDPAQVRTIARWFDRLEIQQPRFMPLCPYIREPIYRFVFRGAHGRKLARAAVPEFSGICSAATYYLGRHQAKSLLAGDFVYRVQQLIGANWIGPPDVEGLARQRKADAQRAAAKLLHDFTPPPGATRTSQPRDYHGALDRSGPTPFGEVVELHRFWQTRAGLAAVASFEKTHGPPGLRLDSSGVSPRPPRYQTLSFSSRSRLLNMTVMRLPTRTIVRVDAKVTWLYPRSPRERVPAGVREVDVNGLYSAKVTDSAKIEKIVGWFDALPIVPPGIGAYMCPALLGRRTTFAFLGANGERLAWASFGPDNPPLGVSGVCNPFSFSIRGRKQTPLLGGKFVGRVRVLLGIRVSDERSGG